jgi:outer membrane protein assembly factor BamE (lipoprotein component of BamABCDE complex)
MARQFVEKPDCLKGCFGGRFIVINLTAREAQMRRIYKVAAAVLVGLLGAGCQTAGEHRRAVQDDTGDRLTVGKVQREIRVGMPSADVVSVLGSPNMVSTDEERREVWVYDKIATERVYSGSSGGVNVLFLGFGSEAAGGLGGGGSASAGASSTSQRTLTIIIKFDKEGKVRDFAYHTSRF